MSFNAVVFDFDGTLVDSEPAHFEALRQVLLSYQINLSFEDYRTSVIGLSDRDSLRKLLASRLDPSELEESLTQGVDAKKKVFQEIAPQLSQFQPGVLDLIHQMKQNGKTLAIASGALRTDIELLLSSLGGSDFIKNFAVLATASDVLKSKPNPETYLLALKGLGLLGSACISFEDTPVGLQSAKKAGLFAVAVTHTLPKDQLVHWADLVLAGFVGLKFSEFEMQCLQLR
jgi:beta-phosphoglucomutase